MLYFVCKVLNHRINWFWLIGECLYDLEECLENKRNMISAKRFKQKKKIWINKKKYKKQLSHLFIKFSWFDWILKISNKLSNSFWFNQILNSKWLNKIITIWQDYGKNKFTQFCNKSTLFDVSTPKAGK